MKKKIKQKLLTVVFFACWFAVLLIASSMEQQYISTMEAVVYSAVTFITLGVSGFLSGLLVLPDERRQSK